MVRLSKFTIFTPVNLCLGYRGRFRAEPGIPGGRQAGLAGRPPVGRGGQPRRASQLSNQLHQQDKRYYGIKGINPAPTGFFVSKISYRAVVFLFNFLKFTIAGLHAMGSSCLPLPFPIPIRIRLNEDSCCLIKAFYSVFSTNQIY